VDHRLDCERRRVGGIIAGLTNRQQPPVAEHDVDLPRGQHVLDERAVVHGDVEVVAIVLELGALAAVMEVLGGQVTDLELLREGVQLRLRGVDAVDPQQRVLRVDEVGELVGGGVLVPVDVGAVQPCPDHSRPA
jgi:hypothetical protein